MASLLCHLSDHHVTYGVMILVARGGYGRWDSSMGYTPPLLGPLLETIRRQISVHGTSYCEVLILGENDSDHACMPHHDTMKLMDQRLGRGAPHS